jgi:DNA-binding MarR family transcriptional regulator
MHATPAAASYHVKALVSAGLVTRERRGRAVIVERTARGTNLLELYER